MTNERTDWWQGDVPPPSTLEELGARLWGHDKDPDPLRRRIAVLNEILCALHGTSPTIAQLLVEAMDAQRKNRIGPAARSVVEVVPLVKAAAIATWFMEASIPASAAYAAVAKIRRVDGTKLKTFRQNLQRGRQSRDTLTSYNAHLNELRIYAAGRDVT